MPARIVRADEAPTYLPPNHEGVIARRLQGHDAGQTERFWVGQSNYAPGAEASTTPTNEETVYVVLEGELQLNVDGGEQRIGAGDSVHLPRGTVRSLKNATQAQARILVIVALPIPEAAGSTQRT